MLNGFLFFFGSYLVVFWAGYARGRRRGKAEAYGAMAKELDALEEEFLPLEPIEPLSPEVEKILQSAEDIRGTVTEQDMKTLEKARMK
jgi:hypothetical protein